MNHKNIFLITIYVLVISSFTCNIFPQQILVNKAGYLPGSVKVVYFSHSVDSFFVQNEASQLIVFSSKAELYKQNDPSTGLTIYKGNFSAFTQPGKYVITEMSGIRSSVFDIADTVFNSVYTKSLKEFYFQRCGTSLLPEHAGIYQHGRCHYQTDGTFHSTTDTSGKTIAFGGWHDAGDYGKYVINAGISAGTLLMAYELFPGRFSTDNLNIPESGNQVPDILDETRYELDWFFTMQNPDGAVYAKLTREQFEGFVMPQFDNTIRYIYQVSSAATADFAAVMARAYRVFKPFDIDYANKCLAAAQKAWEYLELNPQIFPPGGFRNPPGTATGEYGDGNDSDERLWASAELFESTGDTAYHTFYLNNYNRSGLFTNRMSWPSVRTMAQLTYLFGKNPEINQAIISSHRTALLSFCETLVQRSNADGLNVSIVQNEYNWGSNSNVLNNAILLIAGYQLNSSPGFYNTALYQLNYILGANAHDLSFVTGVGDRHSMRIHHRPSGSDNIVEPVPGLLAGGPNRNINNDPVLQRTFTTSTPPALCYIDDQGSYASNENCINWNAPLVFVSGFFNGEGTPVSIKESGSESPTGLLLEQNYPNPFNPSTTINYRLSAFGNIKLTVYNLLGQKIKTLINSFQNEGDHSIVWPSTDNSNNPVCSGIYVYKLEANNMTLQRKMILVR